MNASAPFTFLREMKDNSWRNKFSKFGLAGALLSISLVSIFFYYLNFVRGDFADLLRSDTQLRVRNIVVRGHTKEIAFQADETQYLEGCLRSAIADIWCPGTSYDIYIVLSNGQRVHAVIRIEDSIPIQRLGLAFPLDQSTDPIEYYVPLRDPVPAELKTKLESLISDSQVPRP